MRYITRVAVLAAALVALPLVAHAQTLGTLAGSVKDASGAVLPGVTVEAASPALIEKVRTGVTDGTGLYRLVNLPPGTYTVSFTLTGFNVVRREDVVVAAGVTVTIDADMRVGAVEETITVTGESPVVDLQSASQTRTVTAEVFKEIPSSGSWIQMASLVPAVRASIQDVGGVLGDQTGAQISAHGSRPDDGVSMIDGLRIGNMYISSNLTNMSLSPLLFDEVNVQLSGQVAETGTNGVIMNAIPKSGGNSFHGSALANGSGPGLQANNVTTRLNDRGLNNASTTLKTLYDINGAVGGPIMKDKVWFYATSRYFTNEYYLASRYFPADVTQAVRVEDRSQQAYAGTYTYDNNGRVTWAINEKQKLSGWYAYQYKEDPHWLINVFNYSPEAARVTRWHTQLSTTKYTYAATSKLLFEAGLMAGASPDTIRTDLTRIGGISLTAQNSGGFLYRAPNSFDWDDRLPSQSFNVSSSYVTGSHNAKFGFELQRGHFQRNDNNDQTGGIWYTVDTLTNPNPLQVTIQAPLQGYQNNLNYNLGLFAQDRWTVSRMTLSAGLRLDFLNESTEPFTATPHKWQPTRNTTFAAVKNVPNWKDIDPRVSVAYDLFGNGKTALKASASRSIEQDSIRYASANNPAATISTQTARTWNDLTFPVGDPRRANFTPDCDLLNPAANGECGAYLTPTFGSTVPITSYDPKIMNGWGVRPYNWEFSGGLQQQLAPRVSASLAYYRRIFGNFNVLDNESLGPNDFTEYSVVIPTGTVYGQQIPGAGTTLGGFYDPKSNPPAKNVIKDAGQFGKEQLHYDGFDVNVDARLKAGVYLQGGVSVGKTMSDFCQIIDDVPEALNPLAGVPTGVQSMVASAATSVIPFGAWTPKGFCHQETPYQPLWKALATYTLPLGVRVAGTFQSLPGPMIAANTTYNASTLGLTTLGRPFTIAGQSIVNTVQPGTLWGDRLNQFDLRFTKVVGVGYGRVDLNVDIYNAFNSDAIITQQNTFGAANANTGAGSPTSLWTTPTSVIQPRFVKFSARWDF
jgi:hypothetical protein